MCLRFRVGFLVESPALGATSAFGRAQEQRPDETCWVRTVVEAGQYALGEKQNVKLYEFPSSLRSKAANTEIGQFIATDWGLDAVAGSLPMLARKQT